VRVTLLFPSRWIFRALFIFLLVLARTPCARADASRVPPPRAEIDAGPPPLPRTPELARRPFAVASELAWSLPTCRDGSHGAHCNVLAPAFGGGVALLHRPLPYFAFGGAFAVARATGGGAEGELLAGGALGRVYFYESGAFDPHLELELGYGSLRTTLPSAAREPREERSFGAMARAGGGLDFVVLPALELGASLGYRQLVFERLATCASGACRAGAAPSGALTGALVVGLRATLVFGAPL
jgi:hypothetical protein